MTATGNSNNKYQQPENKEILKRASEKIRIFRKGKHGDGSVNFYRLGIYTGINIVRRIKGEEPL